MGVFGAYLVGVRLIGIDNGAFWGNMQAGVDFWHDIVNGIIKSVVFGVAVSLIAVFEGYDAKPTAEGVSTATTRTVVGSSLAILGARLRPHRLHVPGRGVTVMTAPRTGCDAMNRIDHRPVGRHLRHDRHRRDPLSRAQGRQLVDFGADAGLPARGALRQHRRPEAARAGQGGRRRRRPRRDRSSSTRRPTRPSSRCGSTRATSSRRTRSRRSSRPVSWARSTSGSTPAATRRCSPTAARSPRRNRRSCSRS